MDMSIYLIWSVVVVLQVIIGMKHEGTVRNYQALGLSCFFSVLALVFFVLSAPLFAMVMQDASYLIPGLIINFAAMGSIIVAVAALFKSLKALNLGQPEGDRRPERTGPKRSPESERAYSKMYFAKKREVKRLQERIEELELLFEGNESVDSE